MIVYTGKVDMSRRERRTMVYVDMGDGKVEPLAERTDLLEKSGITNVRGFDWGRYGGEVTHLSLALLSHFFVCYYGRDFSDADNLACIVTKDFRSEVLYNLDQRHFTLTEDTLRAWCFQTGQYFKKGVTNSA